MNLTALNTWIHGNKFLVSISKGRHLLLEYNHAMDHPYTFEIIYYNFL